MFTGIVEEAGQVVDWAKTDNGCRFEVECTQVHQGVRDGDSIANNGCCLTVAAQRGRTLVFDLLEETQRVTNLGDLAPGRLVNLERSLLPDSRLGGHFVTGHVDTAGIITVWEQRGSDWELEVEVPAGFERFLVPKGCIAVDGISLTVGRVEGRRFNMWIIPHTLERTALRDRTVGQRVNLEFDMLAKYVEKILAASRSGT